MNPKKNFLLIFFVLATFAGIESCFAQPEKSNYKILRTINVEGDGGWDMLTVDTMHERLFISHGTITQVVDIRSGNLLRTIPDTKGVHGIALSYSLNKGFISNGRDTSVTVFNLTTLETIEKIKVTGMNPDAILYDPFTKKIFTFNGRSSNSTVIDAASDKIISTIPLPGKPEFAVSDGKGKVYANIEDKSLICVIDPVKMNVITQWSIAPGEEPSGLAIDVKNNLLFSGCDNKLMAISDIASQKVIDSLPIGVRVDGAEFDPALHVAYSSNGEGTITVVKEESSTKFSVLETVTTQKGARTMALDYKTHLLYLPTAEFGDTPAPTSDNPNPRPPIKPGTFVVLEVGR
ncbi:MAG: YncE family protein [Chitinophagales bacterium]